ncbi:MAG: hypothetical protein J5508_05540, partial [Bacteroidales bacterium]|nr:hypothetical protein [Bacteroidales bacterium]
MKSIFKLFLAVGFCACLTLSCDKYDDSQLRSDISSLSNRVSTLESLMNSAQSNIQSLLTLTESINKNYFITAVNPLSDGYEIVFSNGSKATIKNGSDGHSPVIGVKKGTDGKYYWTLDGEWLYDADGDKLPVSGEDGLTPQLKIEDGFWYVSRDNGKTWTKLGQATGGSGNSGDSIFKEVSYDENFVYFTLGDGTKLKVGRGANGVQAIAVVPDLEDGGVLSVLNEFPLRFDVLPASAAEAIAAIDPSCFRVNLVYTQTKVQAGDELSLPITSIKGANGRVTVTVDGSSMCEDFAIGKLAASASLSIDDGTNAVTSGYFPVRYDNERIKKLIEKQWTVDFHPTETIDVGYTFKNHILSYVDGAGENSNLLLDGSYYVYQLPNGDIKVLTDNTDCWEMFKNVTETTALFVGTYYSEEKDYTPYHDEYGWYTGSSFITIRDNPIKISWKGSALKIGGKYYPTIGTCYDNYDHQVHFVEDILKNTDQILPIV